jgi:hypothetical protein
MKLKDVVEASVVDLATFRQKKTQRPPVAGGDPIGAYYRYDQLATNHLTELVEWATQLKTRVRVPGFETLDDVSYYLVITLKLPADASKFTQWFGQLSERDHQKVVMIAHHASRLKKVYNQILIEIKRFQDYWWKKHTDAEVPRLDAMDAASSFELETKNDIKELERVETVVSTIGLQ